MPSISCQRRTAFNSLQQRPAGESICSQGLVPSSDLLLLRLLLHSYRSSPSRGYRYDAIGERGEEDQPVQIVQYDS